MAEAWLARAKDATSLARKIEPVLEAVESQMKKPGEAPEIKEAVAKATEYERLASSAKTGEDRDYYARMHRKWLRLADGWRFIADVDGRVRG